MVPEYIRSSQYFQEFNLRDKKCKTAQAIGELKYAARNPAIMGMAPSRNGGHEAFLNYKFPFQFYLRR